MELTDDELLTLEAACEALAKDSLWQRMRSGSASIGYILDDNKALTKARALQLKLAAERRRRGGEVENE